MYCAQYKMSADVYKLMFVAADKCALGNEYVGGTGNAPTQVLSVREGTC